MMKHTIELTDTIEYKKYKNALLSLLIVAILYLVVLLITFLYIFIHVPFEYAIPFVFASLLVWSPLICVIIYHMIKFLKNIKHLKNHFDEYIEFTLNLPTPIDVGLKKIKYVISITFNGKNYDVVSDVYHKHVITSNTVLAGFDEKSNKIIFLKCI